MILKKLEQNRDALMSIGTKAAERGREIGLTPSVATRSPEAIIDHEDKMEPNEKDTHPLTLKR